METFVEWIVAERKKRGWNQAALAERAGVTRATIKLAAWRVAFAALGVVAVLDITPATIRRALVQFGETHNAGGIHALYRALRTFLRWYATEAEPDNWHNPIDKVHVATPKESSLPPIPLDNFAAMLATCDKSPAGLRDRAILLSMLDTGCRASEFVALDVDDLDSNTGAIIVRRGKGGKQRAVFLGAKSLRAVLACLRQRGNPDTGPLFVTLESAGRLSYNGLRQIVRRRAEAAHVPVPSLHSFRRAFALACLRNGVDLISLQRLMGHADLSVIRRYLAQDVDDLAASHRRGSPVDRLLL